MATATIATACALALAMLLPDAAGASAAPGLVLHPTQGPPNSVVSFNGSGFCARASCGAVSVSFNNGVVAGPVQVHADGSISGAFYVPSGPNGWQRVVASQPGASLSATALYFVGTSLPGPTGPQPTVSYTPSPASVPIVHSTAPESPVTTPPAATPTTGPATSTNSPSGPATSSSPASSTAVANGETHRSSGTGWWTGFIVIVVLGAAAAAAIAIRRRSA